MDIHKGLAQLGLNQSEITVYLYILEQGLATPPQIAKGTRIARSNTYHILKNLKEKGFIESQQKHKRKAYLANDPIALIEHIEGQKKQAEKLLPELRALYHIQKNKPQIRFFDGWEQVKHIYWQTYNAKKVYAIGSTKHLADIQDEFIKQYFQGIKDRNIIFYDILSDNSEQNMAPYAKELLKGLYEYALVPKRFDDFQTDILIWDDSIALISLDEPIFGTILRNPPLAQSFTIMFQIMYEQLSRRL